MKTRPESKNSRRWRPKLTRCLTLLRAPRKFITVFVKCTIINYWKGRSLGFCYVLLTSKAGLSILPHVVLFFNTQKRNLLCLLHTYKMNAFTFECLETHRNEPLRSIFEIKKQMFQGFFSLFGRIQRHPSDILTKNPDNNSEKLCAISPLQYVSTSSMLHFQVC